MDLYLLGQADPTNASAAYLAVFKAKCIPVDKILISCKKAKRKVATKFAICKLFLLIVGKSLELALS